MNSLKIGVIGTSKKRMKEGYLYIQDIYLVSQKKYENNSYSKKDMGYL
ncbi:hypothetical protein [Halarcobacter anaerophilus]|nr:hypothetical protein [Halarcobacter anaerophilus]